MNANKSDVLLVSASTHIPNKKRIAAFSVLAGMFLVNTVDCFIRSGVGQNFFVSLFITICCIAYLRFRKFIYISEEGFVKESETFFTKARDVLPWGEIDGITLLSRGSKIMAVIEKPNEMTGWKLYFKIEDMDLLKAILKEHLAKQRINFM